MTLAAIFLSFSFALQTSPLQATLVVQAQSTAPATTSEGATQDQSSSQQSPSSTSQTPPPSKTTPESTGSNPHPALRHKKKVTQANCTPASGGSSSAAGQTAASGKPAGNTSGNGSASNSAQTKASVESNCPPSKVIVRQGGTSEPAIQLAGGDDSSKTRGDAAQNLATAEANLQKIAGRDLTPGQRDMVTQIGKFMDQSKAATAAGDVERARTLAWKAQTLSEELVNPQK
jgi:hypothetical protein